MIATETTSRPNTRPVSEPRSPSLVQIALQIRIGNSFAMLEAHVLTALLARRFDARLIKGHRPQIEMGGTLMVQNGLPMQIERHRG
jgi:hypothetical protein